MSYWIRGSLTELIFNVLLINDKNIFQHRSRLYYLLRLIHFPFPISVVRLMRHDVFLIVTFRYLSCIPLFHHTSFLRLFHQYPYRFLILACLQLSHELSEWLLSLSFFFATSSRCNINPIVVFNHKQERLSKLVFHVYSN